MVEDPKYNFDEIVGHFLIATEENVRPGDLALVSFGRDSFFLPVKSINDGLCNMPGSSIRLDQTIVLTQDTPPVVLLGKNLMVCNGIDNPIEVLLEFSRQKARRFGLAPLDEISRSGSEKLLKEIRNKKII